MIFITYNEDFVVQLMHNMPFDEQYGLGKSQEELLQLGALVNEIPEIEVPQFKQVVYKYNQEDNTVYTELIDRPLTAEEQLQKKVEQQDLTIDTMLLATDELYTMVEPLLASIPQSINVRGVSKMVDLYVVMVMRGLKTIEEVPARYRQQVKDILNELEK